MRISVYKNVIFLSIIFVFILFTFNNKFYQPKILGDLKLRYISSNNYSLFYQGNKIAGTITAVDSWYIQKPYVYGTTTNLKTKKREDLTYFFINVCSGNIYTTSDYSVFYKFLDAMHISKDDRNWMSGNNALDIKKAEYSSSVDCKKY